MLKTMHGEKKKEEGERKAANDEQRGINKGTTWKRERQIEKRMQRESRM